MRPATDGTTPQPWRREGETIVGGTGQVIGVVVGAPGTGARVNADLIVTAVNVHAALVALVTEAYAERDARAWSWKPWDQRARLVLRLAGVE